MRKLTCLRLFLTSSALVLPAIAAAQATPREAALEDRLARLEGELQQLRSELQAARTPPAPAPSPPAAPVVQVAANAQPSASPATAATSDGFRSGTTTIRLGGYVKLAVTNSRFSDGELATNSLGRDFYLPQQIPVDTGRASRVQDFNAKQTRLWFNLTTEIAGHHVAGYIETDFQTAPGTQGTQRTTNGYNLALRRAYIQVDRLTLGEDWTTFQNVAALPESTDFVGATEGTVFGRQPLIRYSAPLGKGLTLHASIENPEAATSTLGNAALVENGDDRLPDFAARLVYGGHFGEVSLAGLAREVHVTSDNARASNFGWGLSGSGKIFLSADRSSDLRFMATYGRNIGRYVGINFAPDSVYVPATHTLADVDIFAAFAAAHIALTPQLRINLIGSYQSVGYDTSLARQAIAGFNDSAWSAAGNIFWSPMRNVDFGVEYRHGVRALVNGNKGQLDRLEFAAKYSF